MLEERALCELRAGDVRQRYYRQQEQVNAHQLLAELVQRFQQRETKEVARVGDILKLAAHDGCQVNALVAYFGEERESPCGHCSYCTTGRAMLLPPQLPLPALPGSLDVSALDALVADHPHALQHPRQRARFLCGLSSPALVKAKLTRHPLFATLENRHFHDVLAWCGGV